MSGPARYNRRKMPSHMKATCNPCGSTTMRDGLVAELGEGGRKCSPKAEDPTTSIVSRPICRPTPSIGWLSFNILCGTPRYLAVVTYLCSVEAHMHAILSTAQEGRGGRTNHPPDLNRFSGFRRGRQSIHHAIRRVVDEPNVLLQTASPYLVQSALDLLP